MVNKYGKFCVNIFLHYIDIAIFTLRYFILSHSVNTCKAVLAEFLLHTCKIHLISTSGWKSGAIFVQNPPHFYIWLEIWCHIRIQHTQFHIRRRILVIAINRAFLLNFFCACTELVYIQSEDRFGFSARDFLSEDEILLLYPDKQGHYC